MNNQQRIDALEGAKSNQKMTIIWLWLIIAVLCYTLYQFYAGNERLIVIAEDSLELAELVKDEFEVCFDKELEFKNTIRLDSITIAELELEITRKDSIIYYGR